MKLIPHILTPKLNLFGLWSLTGFGNLIKPLIQSVLYSQIIHLRLALKLFRGEPAISEFDWPFTPIHNSSHGFSTPMQFGPPHDLTRASSWSWIVHSVSGLCHVTYALSNSLSLRLHLFGLTLATYHNSPVRYAKSTPSDWYIYVLWLLVGTRFQILFHSPHGVLFTFPSRYLFTIGCQLIFSLGRWSSLFPTRFHVAYGTQDTN